MEESRPTGENETTLRALRDLIDKHLAENECTARFYLVLGIEGDENLTNCMGIASREMDDNLAIALASVILSHVVANSDEESIRTRVSMARTLLYKSLGGEEIRSET